ncbi:hypothetical protein Mal4_10800 [Maioricimonas rarisocia]|uniref:Antitoxin SocA-like Panacea domain-containing protein n=1 Tax=Maioricimonas rarisocia TaxID=2528026 RepID=A0A517Z2R7_9PLAN|nr:hypothetical protein [Maioricimonas rarisocia]QDU36782.1 hypothetical protein Mal4_10800 [Maioricimonas rarisocia]
MNIETGNAVRTAVLTRLVEHAPKPPGRTVLMKWAYLLQVLRGVPLGYRFSLYNYGPYDASVLNDLSSAVAEGKIREDTVRYASGSGYQYRSVSDETAQIFANTDRGTVPHDDDVEWVLAEFGNCSASELELVSTIVFANREMTRKGQAYSRESLSRRVRAIKPQFDEDYILGQIDRLVTSDVLSIGDASGAVVEGGNGCCN